GLADDDGRPGRSAPAGRSGTTTPSPAQRNRLCCLTIAVGRTRRARDMPGLYPGFASSNGAARTDLAPGPRPGPGPEKSGQEHLAFPGLANRTGPAPVATALAGA